MHRAARQHVWRNYTPVAAMAHWQQPSQRLPIQPRPPVMAPRSRSTRHSGRRPPSTHVRPEALFEISLLSAALPEYEHTLPGAHHCQGNSSGCIAGGESLGRYNLICHDRCQKTHILGMKSCSHTRSTPAHTCSNIIKITLKRMESKK